MESLEYVDGNLPTACKAHQPATANKPARARRLTKKPICVLLNLDATTTATSLSCRSGTVRTMTCLLTRYHTHT